MTSINNFGNSGYYQLTQSGGGAGGANQSGTAGAQVRAAANRNAIPTGDNNAAYLLNLSPQAQQYLSGSRSAQQSFQLSRQQQQAVDAIIAQYKDAPFNQETFNRIQDDLNEAGLGVETLKMLDKAKHFNATSVLISALTGGKGGAEADGFVSDSESAGKADGYLQTIVSQWKNLVATAKDKLQDVAGDDTSKDAVQAAGGSSGS
jgi:hypothetical protein